MKQTQKFLLVLILLIISVPTWAMDSLNALKSRAEQGDIESQVHLASLLNEKKDVPQAYSEAAKWFKKAAEQESAATGMAVLAVMVAQYNLGTMYDNGRGVPQDYKEAIKWYRKAAEQGYSEAQNNLGRMYANGYGVHQNYVEAYMWCNLAAAQGNELATKNRDAIQGQMTPAQIAAGQKKASEWMKSHPKQESK